MSNSLRPHGQQHTRLPWQSPSPAQTVVHRVSDSIQPSHPLSSPSPPAFNLFQHKGLFQWVRSSHQVAKVLEFQLKHQSFMFSPEHSGLISFRIDWFDLLAAQGTFKSLFQHHSSKASIIRHSVFFMVQISHSYMTIGKTIALTIWTFIGKVLSLLSNMLSSFQHQTVSNIFPKITTSNQRMLSFIHNNVKAGGCGCFSSGITTCIWNYHMKLPHVSDIYSKT